MTKDSYLILRVYCFSFFIFIAFSACQWEGGDRVRLIIGSEVPYPYPFDEIEVSVTASRSENGDFCRFVSKSFPVSSREDIPVIVDYVFGSNYRSWAAAKVRWLFEGNELAHREIIVPFFPGERNEIKIDLQASCINVSCGWDSQCIDGICSELPSPDPLDKSALVDENNKCAD